MFEEEAKEYTKQRAKVLGINDLNLAYHAMQRAYQYGAEFGYNKAKEEMQEQGLALQSDMNKTIEQNIALKKELNKANEWHYPSKGEYPKVNQECYFIHSNHYGEGNKPIFTKSSIQVHAGIYTYALDEEGNETTDLCFYDDFIEEEMDINEVYAWKEIELPKEIKEND